MPARVKFDHDLYEIMLWTSRDLEYKAQNLSSRKRDKKTGIWRIKPLLSNLEELFSVFGNDFEMLDPYVQQLLDRERGRNILFQNLKNKEIPAEMAPYDYNTRPLPHQVAGTVCLLQRNRVLLGDQPGLGKTKQMIDAMCSRMQQGQLQRVLVVCPKSVKWNWHHELMPREECENPPCHLEKNKNVAHHGLPGYEKAMVIDGSMSERLEQFMHIREYQWIIMSYETLRIHAEDIAGEFEGQAIVFDEVHRLKNDSAKVTKAAFDFAERVRFLVAATGTPLANEAIDVWPVAHMVEPGLLGWKKWHFENRFVVKEVVTMELFDREAGEKKPKSWKKKTGYKNLDVLRNLLDTIMIRRLRDHVLELPPKNYQKRILEMKGDQLERYEAMRLALVTQYKYMPERDFQLQAKTAGTQLIRLQMIADGFVQAEERHPEWLKNNAKFEELDEIIEDSIAAGEKVVIFTRFRAPIDEVVRRYEKHGIVWIHGDVKDTDRFERVQAFQGDPNTRIFVSQVITGGQGINLTASHTQVHIDRWWSVTVNEQAEDRQQRLGMDTSKPLTIIDLMIRGTVDTRIAKILREKRELSHEIMGDDFRLTKSMMMNLLGEGEDGGEQVEDLEF